jgi:hypothetical protein
VALALGLLSSVVVLLTGLTGGIVFLLWKNPMAAAAAAPPRAANDGLD